MDSLYIYIYQVLETTAKHDKIAHQAIKDQIYPMHELD